MSSKSKKVEKVMTGVGITAAVAAAAAGAYFLYGTSEGKKQRKRLSGWTMKMKKEMVARMKKLKEVNEEAYQQVVDTVAKRYKNLKDVDPQELVVMARELKAHWKNIQREFQAGSQTVKKMAKSGAKKAKKVKRAIKRPKSRKRR